MEESRFLLYSGYGNRQTVLTKVKNYVQEFNLGIEIPLVKFETGRSKEFYFGVALQTHGNNKILESSNIRNMHSYIGSIPIKNNQSHDGLFAREEVKKLLAGNVEWEGFNAKIHYEIQKAFYDPTIIQDEYVNNNGYNENCTDQNETYFRFYKYLSSRRQGSYNEFIRLVKLFFKEPYNKPWPVMRKLLLLGLIEIDSYQNKYWYVTPFSLTQCNSQPERAYISGQFLPQQIDAISNLENCKLTMENNQNTLSTYILSTEHEDVLSEICEKLSIQLIRNSANKLLELLPTVDHLNLYLYENDHINEIEYSIFTLDDKPCTTSNIENGVYIVKHQSTQDYDETALKLNGKWFSGSYYDVMFFDKINNTKELPSCIYIEDEASLLIPGFLRPPFLFEKALIQCSGSIPTIEQFTNANYLKYHGVSHDFVDMLSTKTMLDIKRS
ncbi:hypothetical protein MN086_06430 [Sulfurovum sp. XGS-02]|uniref:hypothetical protein n=1 Tax=Sulfurovum sp. XGS-02 TaxID=2925411 RepID=UPI00205EE88A|nr:hypothetical protein [Sulfurovum sp. XGS-02]UPT76689.1 hypothetical protein MN086_06430 [Sulfurovum sp. XGS-02]